MDDSLEVIREPLERIPSCLVREQTQLDSLQAKLSAPNKFRIGLIPTRRHFRVISDILDPECVNISPPVNGFASGLLK